MTVDDRLGSLVILVETGRRHGGLELLDRLFRRGDPAFEVADPALPRFGVLAGLTGVRVGPLLLLERLRRLLRLSAVRHPLPAFRCPLPAIRFPLPGIRCPLPAARGARLAR